MIPEKILEIRERKVGWRFFSHLLFWLTFFLANLYFNSISFNPFQNSPLGYLSPIRTTLGYIFLYYSLVYLVGLELIYHKKYIQAMAVFMLLFLLYAVLDYYAEIAILENCKKCIQDLKEASLSYYNYLQQGLMNVVFTRIISMGLFFGVIYNLTLPLVIKLTLSYYRKHIESLKLSRDNIQLELNFLKSQVNPHFLFNTLNNLYGLIIHQRNEQSAETVARLSEFLRYSLYQSVQDNVPLKKEINLLKSYLQLEQLRLNYAKVIFEDEVDDQEYYLPPLLFMPIVENAFKYSPDTTESIIFIKLEGKNGRLNLTVKNSIQQGEVTITKGGIGLLNLKKRLSIYFPEKHMFEMKNDGKEYTARLSLFL